MAEEKKENPVYQDLKKEKKKTIFRLVALTLAAFFVIIALSIAWFVNNTRVDSTGITISADMKNVELRTYGGAGIHDDLLKKITGSEQTGGGKSFWYELGTKLKNVASFFETSSDKYAINWLLSDTSNMGNYKNVSNDETSWEDYWKNPPQGAERQDEAIEPGSSGELTFYVVPKYDGAVELNMNLSLIPYKAEGDKFKEITADSDDENKIAKNFIDGHILFFLEKETGTDGTGTDETKTDEAGTVGTEMIGTEGAGTAETSTKKEIQWIKDGTFQIIIKDAKKDQEYGYTLYWCWPQSFAEAVLKAEDSYLNGRKTLLSEFTNGETMRNTILQGDDLSMVKKPERYFYSNLTKSPLTSGQKELDQIPNMYNKSSSSEEFSADAKSAFVELSSYYNQADQYIGSHVDCVRIRLAAE